MTNLEQYYATLRRLSNAQGRRESLVETATRFSETPTPMHGIKSVESGLVNNEAERAALSLQAMNFLREALKAGEEIFPE